MGYWEFIVPESTTNLFHDPSFALADPDTEWNITGDGMGGEDYARVTTYSVYGFSSAQATLGASAYATLSQTITSTATSYTISAMIRRSAGGVLTDSQCVPFFDDAAQSWDSITAWGGGWYYCVYTGTATAAANEFGIQALEAGLYVDGMQLENKAYATTFCDGTREGCEWLGAEYTSNSSRSAQSRAGGRVRDFEDDYSFEIVDWMGWGVPPHLLNLDSYAILPGAQLNSIKTDVNVLTLTGYFQGSSLANLHALRQALVEELAHDRYPATAKGWQPVRIRYSGAAVLKECEVFYDSGLEGSSILGRAFTERIPVRFLMCDPFWHEVGNSAAILDNNDILTKRYIAARLRSTGQWDDLGLTANPAANGTIYAICVASDGSVYCGGNFDGLNNDGAPADAGCDMVARYDPQDGSWNVLVGASDVNGIVYDIKEGPDGTIYLCGAFTAVNGVGTADYLVSYDPVADTWASLGEPDSGAAAITSAREMAFDSAGDLYVVGEFTNWADVAAADYIAKWDMSASSWGAVGAPSVSAGFVYSIAIDSQDNIVIGGSFTDFAGDGSADYLARWDGSAWDDLNSGTQTGNINSMEFSNDDVLYIGGSFTNQGGDADCDYCCAWNGRQFISMGDALTSEVFDLTASDDGRVFVAANTSFGIAGGLASWNGTAWEIWDTAATMYRVTVGKADPIITSHFDIFIGRTASSTPEISGTATVTNDGTTPAYPVFRIYRSGGDSAILYTLRNETTGKGLMFDYSLLDGEMLTVDCNPGKLAITSSFFGPRPAAILANSDWASFVLQPGANQITCFADLEGTPSPTVTTWLEWQDIYRGMD